MPELFYLYDHTTKQKLEDFKQLAALQGVNLYEDKPSKPVQKGPLPLFGKPEDYKNLSDADREKLTKDMMTKYKRFAQDPVKFASHGGMNG